MISKKQKWFYLINIYLSFKTYNWTISNIFKKVFKVYPLYVLIYKEGLTLLLICIS